MRLALADIRAAARTLAQLLPTSPLLAVPTLRSAGGAAIHIKAECLMPTGSFKIRGATLRVSMLTAEERRRGVIAYSTGNHAQAVAKAAADADVRAVIVMSPDVPQAKLQATRAWGGEVVMAEPSSNARRALAEDMAQRQHLVLIPPYDDLTVMTGQATIGVEVLAQLAPTLPSAVFVPIGGGGLLAGVAAAIKQLAPSVKIIGVEPELEDDAAQSFRQGRRVASAGPSDSVADAIKVQCVGELCFPLMRQHVNDVVTVTEAAIADACWRYFHDAHLVVEPGGAVALAAALRHVGDGTGPLVVLACGGNVTLDHLHALARPVTAQG
jgi:threonine dehydratase